MALTPARVGALALLAAAAAATVLLPPEPRRLERGDTYVQTSARQAESALHAARRAVALRMIRDSVHALATPGADRLMTTVFLGVWSPGTREWFTERVADIVGDGAGIGNAAAAFVRDRRLDPYPTLYYALPAGPDDPCVAIHAERAARPRPLLRQAGPGLLGPCAYYFRFGRPGPAVHAWLRDGGASLAVTSPGYPPPARRPPPDRGRRRVFALLRGGDSWIGTDQRLDFPLSLNACLAGRASGCRDFATGRRTGDRALRALGIHAESLWLVESVSATFLSDLLAEIGPGRFAAFWRASGTFEEAFAGAVGTDLAVWTRRWAQAHIGAGPPPSVVGAAALGTSVGAVIVFLAVAVLVASRRRVQ